MQELTCLQVCFRCQCSFRVCFLLLGSSYWFFQFPHAHLLLMGLIGFWLFGLIMCTVPFWFVTIQLIFLKYFRCSWFSAKVTVSLLLLTKERENCQKDDTSFCTILRIKYYFANFLPKRFHLNDNTIGFHPQTQKLKQHTKYIVPCESTAKRFHLNGNIDLKSEWQIIALKSGLGLNDLTPLSMCFPNHFLNPLGPKSDQH